MLFFMVFLLNATAQKTNSTAVGYLENYQNLPKIKLEQATEAEYNQYKIGSEPLMLKVEESKTRYILPTKSRKIKLKKINSERNDFDGYEYLGYYQKLKMYAVTESYAAENLSYGSFGLIDSLTAHYYHIISIGDAAVEKPVPSVNSQYLVYYYNLVYEANSCFIGIVEVNSDGKPVQRFKEKMSLETNSFAVEGIKWINDKTFIIKTYRKKEVADKKVKIFEYYKANV